MSRAFVKEDTDLPERSGRTSSASGLPPGALNYMTAAGEGRFRERLARLRADAGNHSAEIARLEGILGSVTVVEIPDVWPESVALGAKVPVRGADGQVETCRIVGVDELEFGDWAVSWILPRGKALLGAEVGERVRVEGDNGALMIVKVNMGRLGTEKVCRRMAAKLYGGSVRRSIPARPKSACLRFSETAENEPQMSQMGADKGERTQAVNPDFEDFHLLFPEFRICEYLRNLRFFTQVSSPASRMALSRVACPVGRLFPARAILPRSSGAPWARRPASFAARCKRVRRRLPFPARTRQAAHDCESSAAFDARYSLHA